MFNEKFELEALYDVREKLHEIQEWSVAQTYDNQELYDIIDGLCRVANMYNDVVIQAVRDKGIFTANPQDYIESKLGASYGAYKYRED